MSENQTPEITPKPINNTFSRRFGLTVTGIGFFLFLLGSVPQLFGLDNSEAVGFVQVGVFTIGLLVLCLGGTITLNSLWPKHWRSLAADIGLRVAWSGWVLAGVSGMADLLGLGTSPLAAGFIYFGFWQARGVIIGEVVIFIGFLMMIPYKRDFPPAPSESDLRAEDQANISISLEN
ncbi:MAG: hypothetical protein JW757_07200 [Anaerolineales bacterium]|nr:hypothetical protein [Anaerolineales bacterium]